MDRAETLRHRKAVRPKVARRPRTGDGLDRLINLACAALLTLVTLGDRETLSELASLLPPAQSFGPWGTPEPTIVGSAPGSLTLKADRRGHFVVEALVDGQPVRFLIDSGASKVVLSATDAARLNLRTHGGFTEVYSTAGGFVRAAPVRLGEVRMGDLEMRGVAASVSERPMDISLLGANFLGRLEGYEVSGGQMTLRW